MPTVCAISGSQTLPVDELDPFTQALPGGDALLAAGLAPAFECAIGRRRLGHAETARVDQQPQGGEVGKRLALEDAA
jgi:hypothetical protein